MIAMPPLKSGRLATHVLAEICLSARYSIDWRDLRACEFKLQRALASGDVQGIAAFHSLLLPMPCSLQLAITQEQAALIAKYGTKKRGGLLRLRHAPASSGATHVLRVAFLRGAANSNAERLIALLSLDSQHFVVHVFSSSQDVLSLVPVAAPGGEGHQSLRGIDDTAVARLLSSYDVVLDGGGHTAGNRLPALAQRPTPVSTSVLGFPSSYGGARLVDYLTADRSTSPPHLCAACVARSERLSLLPTTYQVVGARIHSAPPPPRQQHQLDDQQLAAEALPEEWLRDGLTPRRRRRPPPPLLLGSFTRCVRWHPDSFGLWAAVLLRSKPAAAAMAAVGEEGATTAAGLWLLADDHVERSRVSWELGSLGVGTRSRLWFGGWQPRKGVHLARHRLLSLSVDTTPLYGSHTTAADALQASVPLLTLPADSWASRVGASVASAAGAPETVVASHKGFVDLAEALLAPSPPCGRRCPTLGSAAARGSGLGASAPTHAGGHNMLPLAWGSRAIALDGSMERFG